MGTCKLPLCRRSGRLDPAAALGPDSAEGAVRRHAAAAAFMTADLWMRNWLRADRWLLLLTTCAARDERIGLYSCSCDAVINASLSRCSRGCTATTDCSGDVQADLYGDRLG